MIQIKCRLYSTLLNANVLRVCVCPKRSLSLSFRGSEMSAFIGSNFLALHVWAVRCRQAVSEELLIALSRARSAAKFH